jgi:hypothetical protein
MSIEKRVVVAKWVAGRWIRRLAHPEYRLKILYGARGIRNLPNLLRSFRDGKVALEDIQQISDLGIKESFDSLEIWSRNREPLVQLKDWFEKRGLETTGVW